SGALPTGLSLNASTGAITGTVSAAGTFNPVLRVRDTRGKSIDTTSSITTTQKVVVANLGASSNQILLSNTPSVSADWTNPLVDKVINVPSGVVVGSTDPTKSAIKIGSKWGGKLQLVVAGEIQGAGGAAGGGKGGDALEIDTTGLSGQ